MDPQVSNSFIPKKPLTGERTRGNAFGFIVLIAVLVFIASGAAAGGVFVYGRVLQSSLESKKSSLNKSQEAYDPGVIEDLVRLDTRMIQGRSLLEKHISPSSIFTFLSENTLEDVQFTEFEYSITDGGAAAITMKGDAKDFSTVALQSDRFGSSKMLREIVFSDIAIGAEGGVSFSVSATIDLPNLLYSKHLNQTVFVPPAADSVAPASVPAVTATSTSSTTKPSI
ncbi:MAG: hypothetical protein KBD50_02100 [Candidatus Pacebacteria bacterium]|nr:hypothetical protein [Candidatus Paceibacterota bacterium]